MTANWRRDGCSVIVAIPSGQEALWARLTRLLDDVECQLVDGEPRSRVLSLPEAYYALTEGCLPSTQTLVDVWHEFQSVSSCFVAHHIAYSHFRRLGWLLKSGLNYGAQYVLYRGDTNLFHSEYILYITSYSDNNNPNQQSAWHALQALTRVAEDVKKTVLLCEVSCSPPAAAETPAHRGDEPVSTTTSGPAVATEDEPCPPRIVTHARYTFHDKKYTFDAVMIRFWDPTTVDEDNTCYEFAQQPTHTKREKSINLSKTTHKKKTKASVAT